MSYVLRTYGFDKLKIASIIVGASLLLVGFVFFFYYYLVLNNITIGWIFLGTFITTGVVFFVIAIVRQFTARPKYYWGPAADYPQYPQQQAYPGAQQQAYPGAQQQAYPGVQQQAYPGAQQQYQYYGAQAPQYQTQSQYASGYNAGWPSWQTPQTSQQRCQSCLNPARYINEYQRWYCDLCKRWL
ncbi:MAG: hypothetical protein NWE86_02125 [Candidatus Bathyarchaeota archaeon]|nr:hypothetical protein [Candidatus Bathyarchaeota archaeon]